MELIGIKNKFKKFGVLLWIVGVLVAAGFGITLDHVTFYGENVFCAVGMTIVAMAVGFLSLVLSCEYEGSKLVDWVAMSLLAVALVSVGWAFGDRTIFGAAIGHAIAGFGGGIIGIMTPHVPRVHNHHSHF